MDFVPLGLELSLDLLPCFLGRCWTWTRPGVLDTFWVLVLVSHVSWSVAGSGIFCDFEPRLPLFSLLPSFLEFVMQFLLLGGVPPNSVVSVY
eukprot:1281878-Amphidinium_carterae.4